MRKTNLVLGFMLIMLLAMSSGLMAYSGGTGSSGDPYQIAILADLQYLSAYSGDWSKHFIQTADIDAAATSTWDPYADGFYGFSPIGSAAVWFTGSYDGQGYTIDALYINSVDVSFPNNIAFFGYTRVVTIEKLGLTNIYVTGAKEVGGLVGYNFNSTITNCYTTGSVTSTIWNTGGLVGNNYYNSTINNCYSTCTVSGDFKTGGLVGENHVSSIISNCYSTGNVTGANSYTGGFVGSNSSSCSITNCYSTGNVSGINYTGGFVGDNYFSTISNCYSKGSVSGNDYIGGLVGYNNFSDIIQCYSTGNVSGSSNVGGLVGYYNSRSTISNSFWDTETSNQSSSAGGIGKTTAEMKTQSTFTDAGWDFTNTWEMIGYNYPRLQDNPDPTLPVTLSSFTAQFIGSSPILCWTTQSETGNAGWNVYRGDYRDAFINGDAIQINPELIEGAGTTSIPTEYTFEDQYNVVQGNEYWYILESVDYSGETQIHGSVSLIIPEESTTPELPQQTVLMGNYPNPFNPNTTISFTVKENETAHLSIFNIKGQEIKNIQFESGIHNYFWDASSYASGIYLYKLKSESFSEIRKMILMK